MPALRALLDTVALGRDPALARGPGRWLRLLRIAALVVAGLLAFAYAGSRDQTGVVLLGWLIGTATAAPLAIAPWSSLLAWRVSWLVAMGIGAVGLPRVAGWPWHPVTIVVLIAVLFAVGLRQRAAVVVCAGVLTLIPVWVFVLPHNRAGATVLFAVPLVIGWLLQARRSARRELATERERGVLLTERARIARELHDVVAHHMSLIAVRAETAGYRLTGLDEPARREFGEISEAAREAMNEMRRLLGVLRDGEAAPTMPQPGLADLESLVEAARAAGTAVTVEVGGELDGLPAAVDVSAYRIVQEALSNAARHAPGAAVALAVRRTPGEVSILVTNPAGTASPDPSGTGEPGHGLRGMRERVTMLDGEFVAGPRGDGGFQVEARLPIR